MKTCKRLSIEGREELVSTDHLQFRWFVTNETCLPILLTQLVSFPIAMSLVSTHETRPSTRFWVCSRLNQPSWHSRWHLILATVGGFSTPSLTPASASLLENTLSWRIPIRCGHAFLVLIEFFGACLQSFCLWFFAFFWGFWFFFCFFLPSNHSLSLWVVFSPLSQLAKMVGHQ